MTPEIERRLRSIAANIVDLEERVATLRAMDVSGMTHEQKQQHRGDLYVAEHYLLDAETEKVLIKYTGG